VRDHDDCNNNDDASLTSMTPSLSAIQALLEYRLGTIRGHSAADFPHISLRYQRFSKNVTTIVPPKGKDWTSCNVPGFHRSLFSSSHWRSTAARNEPRPETAVRIPTGGMDRETERHSDDPTGGHYLQSSVHQSSSLPFASATFACHHYYSIRRRCAHSLAMIL
jgi:hypothetical protein